MKPHVTLMTGDISGQLERVLSDLVAVHEELLTVAREQRRAMSRADAAAIEACTARQGEAVQKAAGLEADRRRIVASLGGRETASVSSIAAGLPEPARTRIMQIVLRLRDVLMQLQEQTRVLRAAAETIAGNVDGLMQQVSRRLSSAGVYGRQGTVTSGPPVSAFDMRH